MIRDGSKDRDLRDRLLAVDLLRELKTSTPIKNSLGYWDYRRASYADMSMDLRSLASNRQET